MDVLARWRCPPRRPLWLFPRARPAQVLPAAARRALFLRYETTGRGGQAFTTGNPGAAERSAANGRGQRTTRALLVGERDLADRSHAFGDRYLGGAVVGIEDEVRAVMQIDAPHDQDRVGRFVGDGFGSRRGDGRAAALPGRRGGP